MQNASKSVVKQMLTMPSTRGGRIRLLGLILYALTTVVHPPVALALRAAFETVTAVVK